jgi:hypothetical protein
MNFLQTVLLALLANPLVFQQAIIPSAAVVRSTRAFPVIPQASPIFLPVDRLQRTGAPAQRGRGGA